MLIGNANYSLAETCFTSLILLFTVGNFSNPILEIKIYKLGIFAYLISKISMIIEEIN